MHPEPQPFRRAGRHHGECGAGCRLADDRGALPWRSGRRPSTLADVGGGEFLDW